MNRGHQRLSVRLAELIPDAEVRVLPPQASQVRLQCVTYEGRSKTRGNREVFADMSWSSVWGIWQWEAPFLPPVSAGLFLVSRLPYRVKHVWIVPPWAFAPNRDGRSHFSAPFSGHPALGWRIAMNAETDRDLTFEGAGSNFSGGLFFVDDLPAEFADQFRHHDPGAISSSVARSFH